MYVHVSYIATYLTKKKRSTRDMQIQQCCWYDGPTRKGGGKGWTASMNVIFSDKGMRWYSTVLSRCFCLAVLLCTGKYSKFFLLLLYIKIILNYR